MAACRCPHTNHIARIKYVGGLRNILMIWLVTMPLIAAGLMVPRLFVAFPKTTIPEWRQLGWDPGLMASVLIAAATILMILGQAEGHRLLHERPATSDPKAKVVNRSLGAFHKCCFIPIVSSLVCLVLGSALIAAMFHYHGSGCVPETGPALRPRSMDLGTSPIIKATIRPRGSIMRRAWRSGFHRCQ